MRKRLLAWLMVAVMGLGQVIPTNVYAQEATAPVASEQSVATESVTEETPAEKTESVFTTTESKGEEKTEVAPSKTQKDEQEKITEEVTEEATEARTSKKETEQTKKENASKGISTLSESEYVITLNSPQMIQTDGNIYYFQFVAPEAGDYTFYFTDGKINNGNIQITDAISGDYMTSNSWPYSASVTLNEQQQCRIEAYADSSSSAKSYLNVRKYDKDQNEVKVEDVQLPSSVEIGDTFDIRVKFNVTDVIKFEAYGNVRGVSENNPTADEEGYYTLHNVTASSSGSIDNISVIVYSKYGYDYSINVPVSMTIGGLQAKIDACASNGGGILEFTEPINISNEDIVIPENVTLLLNGNDSNIFYGKLEVNGVLKSRNNLYVGHDFSVGNTGSVFVANGFLSVQDTDWGLTKLNEVNNSGQMKIRAGYGSSCYFDGDIRYEFRHGQWRTPLGMDEWNVDVSRIPADEIIDISDNNFNDSFGRDDYYNAFQWYKFTPASDGSFNIRFGNIAANGYRSFRVFNSNSQQIDQGYYDAGDEIVSTGSDSMNAGESYYIFASFHCTDALTVEDTNVSGSFSFEFNEVGITAEKLRNALDFEQATYGIVDSDSGEGKELKITIPIKEAGRGLFERYQYGTLYYNDSAYSLSTLYYDGGFGEEALVFTRELNGIAFEEGSDQFDLRDADMYLYIEENGCQNQYQIASYQHSWSVNDIFHVYGTDFGSISQLNVPIEYMEPIPLSLEETEEVSYGKQVYSFTAIERGTYTFFMTEGNASVYNGSSSLDSPIGNIYEMDAFRTEMQEGETYYILASGWGENSLIGVTADTGEVKLLDIQLDDTNVMVEQGAIGRFIFDKDVFLCQDLAQVKMRDFSF